MKKIHLLLTAFFIAISGSAQLYADEIDLLKNLQFKARPDLAGVNSTQAMREATTGVTIFVNSADASAQYAMEECKDGTLKWFISGRVAKKRKMIYTAILPKQDLGKYRYYTIRTRSRGLFRSFMPHYNVLTCGDTVLLKSGYVFNDGKVHTMVGLLNNALPAGGELKLQLETDNSNLDFEILEFKLSDTLAGDPNTFAGAQKKDWNGFKSLDISAYFNSPFKRVALSSLKKYSAVIDYPEFPALEVKQYVPFKLSDAVRNYIYPPCDEGQLKKQLSVFGNVIRDDFFPPARLDEIVIPLSGKTSEIYALLGCEMPPQQTRYVAHTIPQQFSDVDCFGIQIDYADGSSDRCFPYHIDAKGFVIQGTAAAYAIPVDKNKELKAIRFQNRFIHYQIGVAALTLNDGAPLVIGEELRNPPVREVNPGVVVAEKPLQITRNDREIVLENGHYRVKINIDNQFNITEIVNYHAPDMAIKLANGGLEIHRGNKIFGGKDFKVVSLTEIPNGIALVLQCKNPAISSFIDVNISGSESDELNFKAVLRNTSDKVCNGDFRFPALNDLVLGNVKDTFYYYPKTRVAHSNVERSFHTPVHERAYHVQFLDIYNPVAGAGIALHTRDLTRATFNYGLSKNSEGVDIYIDNEANWNKVQPQSSWPLADTVLQFHGGDWHQALYAYQAWLKTWFKPYPTQLPEKWYNAYYLRAENMYRSYQWCIPMYNTATGQFNYEGGKKITRTFMDCDTDVMHFSFWNSPENGFNRTTNSGNFDDGIYDPANYFSGADNLRNFFKSIQNDGTLVSLYSIATYLPKDSPLGSTIGAKICQVPAGGKGIVQDSKVYFSCLDEWQDYYAKALARAQRELNVDAIYMDCFPFGKYSNACYSKEHGHEVPMQVNRTQHSLLKKVRTQLPANVALWVEDPCIDYDAAYLSGNITYYYTTIHEHRAKSFDINDADGRNFYEPLQNIQRFTMPHLKQVGFPCGWVRSGPVTNEVNALFFNGEGVYDTGWMLFDAHYRPRVRHWLKIQRALTDCFRSNSPEALVPTAAGEIYANKFPGNDRTAWTLWNARYTTYRGAVLEVEHKEGAKYYDAWNVQEIEPEIEGSIARLSISSIDPQGLGCVVQYFGDLPQGLPTRTVAEDEADLIEVRDDIP